MGSTLIRASRDPDSLYLKWSSITDSPTWIFETREDALEHYREEARFRNPYWGDDGHMHIPNEVPKHELLGDYYPDSIVERAEITGTSAISGYRGWDDKEFYVGEGAPPPGDGLWVIPRERLNDFAKALLIDDTEGAAVLLVLRPRES